MQSFRRWRRLAAAKFIHAAWRRMQQAAIITAETAAGKRFASFGPHSLIAFPTGTIYGEGWIRIGDRTMIGEQASVCAGMMPGHDLGPGPVLRIGDGCIIGRGSHIVAHWSIDIGDDVYTGPYVYITDQNHSYTDPDVPVGRQWPVNSAVSIGSGTWLGTGVVILPGSVIGKNVVVAAGSVVRGTIGDHCVVAGVPARVVREFRPGSGWSAPAGSPAKAAALAEALAVPTLPAAALVKSASAEPGPAEPALLEPVLIEPALAEPVLTEPAQGDHPVRPDAVHP
jgi:acetyltransferase-like isoleucine patch superfamily enzyme